MAARTEAPVTASVLRWARETLGLDLAHVAARAKVPSDTLADWEAGRQRPSVAKARALADLYKRPFAVFFLPEPPDDSRPPTDYRRLLDAGSRPLSSELRLAIRWTELRQSFAAERLEKPSPYLARMVSSGRRSEAPERVTKRIREALRIGDAEQTSWRNPDVALKRWRAAAESAGVLVFQASRIDVEEMRGVSFHHPIAPAILLNSADSPRGRIFTLMHELSHLALGKAGLCDYTEPSETTNARTRIEVLCNQMAAWIVVPDAMLTKHGLVANGRSPRDWTDDELDELSRHFSVSREVILRRLLSLGYTSQTFYKSRRSDFLEAARRRKDSMSGREGGPPWHRRVIGYNGRRFTHLVLDAYHEEFITGSDVSELLQTKLGHLPTIEHELTA